MNSIFLNEIEINAGWTHFLTPEINQMLHEIEIQISRNEFTPTPEKVLHFLKFPIKNTRVIILGQDPYPQPGVATGRAFEVGTLKSWNETYKNISLKNILRSIYKAYTGKTITYKNLKTKLDNEFPLLPPNQLFKHWEKQGVLLLNTSFTCKINNPASHSKIWAGFTQKLLLYLNQQCTNATWFLWGNHAREATAELHLKHVVFNMHPMMCYDGPERETDFLFGKTNCFEQLIPKIDWTGFKLSKGLKVTETLF